jgi:hypothetical protein
MLEDPRHRRIRRKPNDSSPANPYDLRRRELKTAQQDPVQWQPMALAQQGLTVLLLAVQQQPVVLEPEGKRTVNRPSFRR